MTHDHDGKDSNDNNNHDQICAEFSSYVDGSNSEDETPNFPTNHVSNHPSQVSQRSSLTGYVPEYNLHTICNDNMQHIYAKLP